MEKSYGVFKLLEKIQPRNYNERFRFTRKRRTCRAGQRVRVQTRKFVSNRVSSAGPFLITLRQYETRCWLVKPGVQLGGGRPGPGQLDDAPFDPFVPASGGRCAPPPAGAAPAKDAGRLRRRAAPPAGACPAPPSRVYPDDSDVPGAHGHVPSRARHGSLVPTPSRRRHGTPEAGRRHGTPEAVSESLTAACVCLHTRARGYTTPPLHPSLPPSLLPTIHPVASSLPLRRATLCAGSVHMPGRGAP